MSLHRYDVRTFPHQRENGGTGVDFTEPGSWISERLKATRESNSSRVLPLAITNAQGEFACVAGLADDNTWVRPEPVKASSVRGVQAPFRYGYYTHAELEISPWASRPEDRTIANTPVLGNEVPLAELRNRMTAVLDESVEQAFAKNRSAGLIRASVRCVYERRHVGNRRFLRMCFNDATGAEHDWIVPDLRFVETISPFVRDGTIDREFELELLRALGNDIYIAIGLTLPNERMPGRFRNCHPLVVGVHSFPDFLSQLSP